jgi:hypothetical protein
VVAPNADSKQNDIDYITTKSEKDSNDGEQTFNVPSVKYANTPKVQDFALNLINCRIQDVDKSHSKIDVRIKKLMTQPLGPSFNFSANQSLQSLGQRCMLRLQQPNTPGLMHRDAFSPNSRVSFKSPTSVNQSRFTTQHAVELDIKQIKKLDIKVTKLFEDMCAKSPRLKDIEVINPVNRFNNNSIYESSATRFSIPVTVKSNNNNSPKSIAAQSNSRPRSWKKSSIKNSSAASSPTNRFTFAKNQRLTVSTRKKA